MFGHPDGEPVARLEEWTQDPFAAAVVAGRLHEARRAQQQVERANPSPDRTPSLSPNLKP